MATLMTPKNFSVHKRMMDFSELSQFDSDENNWIDENDLEFLKIEDLDNKRTKGKRN